MSRVPVVPLSRTRLTPADTIFSASTSSPESVSSRIATFGFSSSSCNTSNRFFSPPEKPSFTERSLNAGSIARFSKATLRSLTHVRSLGTSPCTAVTAVRRKLETLTPGTSTGYCIARNRPAGGRRGARGRRQVSPAGALADSHRENVLAVERHAARGNRVARVPGDRVRERRLAGAVGAHDRVRLALLHDEVDAAEDLLRVDVDVQVADLERGHDSYSFTATNTSSPSIFTG